MTARVRARLKATLNRFRFTLDIWWHGNSKKLQILRSSVSVMAAENKEMWMKCSEKVLYASTFNPRHLKVPTAAFGAHHMQEVPAERFEGVESSTSDTVKLIPPVN